MSQLWTFTYYTLDFNWSENMPHVKIESTIYCNMILKHYTSKR